MNRVSLSDQAEAENFSWRTAVARYQQPDVWRSVWQVANSIIPYLLCWYLAYRALSVSYWLTLALAVLAGGFLIRIFIIFHDCGHGSFFQSRKANDLVGMVTGFLVFTPYYLWRHEHAVHHATAGDLDRRGMGDVWTLTVAEYRALSRWQQLGYRLYRHPVVMLGLGPLFVFLVSHRFVGRKDARPRERNSVYGLNIALLATLVLMGLTIGLKAYVLVQLPILAVATSVGVWLFYVQHQFEGTYWERHEEWDYVTAALRGSSFYKLPRVLQWFSGNIGFHHIHHLSPRIPNYYLEKCHEENPPFQAIEPVTLWSSFRSLTFRLWDEDQRRLIGFEHLKL